MEMGIAIGLRRVELEAIITAHQSIRLGEIIDATQIPTVNMTTMN